MITISLTRIMLFAHDVEALSAFYRDAFGFCRTEHIEGEWTVLNAGACDIALHRIGAEWRDLAPRQPGASGNTKLVLSVSGDLVAFRANLMARGVGLGEIKEWPDGPGPLCDGSDPEGNVFQLVQTV